MAEAQAQALLEPQLLLPPHQQPGAVAMHEATRNRDLEAMGRLVKSQPHLIGSPDVVGRAPLSMACLRGHAEVAAWLLDHGADANATDSNHRTAMYNAASYGFTEVVALLLERQGDPSIGDVEGNTPLTAAAYYGYEPVVRRLLAFKGGRDPDDLDRKGERKWSGLYLACESGHARIARLLLDAGADPTLADTQGMTPLDIARQMSNWRCARLLERSLREPQRVAILRKARALTEVQQGLATLEAQDEHQLALLAPTMSSSSTSSSSASSTSSNSSSSDSSAPATPVRTRGGKRKRSLLLTPPYLRARVQKGRPLPLVEVGAVVPPATAPAPPRRSRRSSSSSTTAGSPSGAASVASSSAASSTTTTSSSNSSSGGGGGGGGRSGGRSPSKRGGGRRRKVQRYHPQQESAPGSTGSTTTPTKQGQHKAEAGAGAAAAAAEAEEPLAAGVARAVVGGALPPELVRELCEYLRVRWDRSLSS